MEENTKEPYYEVTALKVVRGYPILPKITSLVLSSDLNLYVVTWLYVMVC
jgi:hypothetical protein